MRKLLFLVVLMMSCSVVTMAQCDLSISVNDSQDACDSTEGIQTNVYTITGGSGDYIISGDFNGSNDGEPIAIQYTDGVNTDINVVDAADATCTASYSEVINCVKAEDGCAISISVKDECNSSTGIQTNVYTITGGSGDYVVSGDFEGSADNTPIALTYSDNQTASISVVDAADATCTASYSEIINCVKADDGCELNVLVIEDCDEVTNAQTNYYTVTGGSGNYTVSGDFNGTVTSGEQFAVDYSDGQTTNLVVVDAADAECTETVSIDVNCAKAGCELNVLVIEDCDEVTNAQTNYYTVTGGSGNYTVSGDFNGTVTSGDQFAVDYSDGQTTNLVVVDAADTECTETVSIDVNCAKAGCELTITATEDCDKVTGLQTNVFTISGGSGDYVVSGDFNGANDGSPIIIVYNDGVTTDFNVVDADDATCTASYAETITCAKDAVCDIAVGVVSACTDNNGNEAEEGFYFVCIETITGGSGNYNYIPGQCISVPAGPYVLVVSDEDVAGCSETVFVEGDECDKTEPCDLVITAVTECPEDVNDGSYNLYILVTGTTPDPAVVSGSYNGAVDVNIPFFVGTFLSNEAYNFQILNGDGTVCTETSGDFDCTKPAVCETPITATGTLTCDSDANGFNNGNYTYTFTITGGSGEYNLSGSVNENGNDGSAPIVVQGEATPDGVISVTISDPAGLCDDVVLTQATSACIKFCENPLGSTYTTTCNNNGTYSATITVTGGSGVFYVNNSSGSTTSSPISVGPFALGADAVVNIFDTNPACTGISINIAAPTNCEPEPETGSIGDTVFLDTNGNGIQDAGEVGIAGVTVTLTYPNGTVVTTTTDGNGNYLFYGLPAGNYTVTVGTGPDNTTLSTAGSFNVSLSEGEDDLDNDFGFTPDVVPVCNAPISVSASLVCNADANGFNDGTYTYTFAISGGSGVYNIAGDYQENGSDGSPVVIPGAASINNVISITISDPAGLCDDFVINQSTASCVKVCDNPLVGSAVSTCNDNGTYSAVITVTGGSGSYFVNNSSGSAVSSPIAVGPFTVGVNNSVNIFDANPACNGISIQVVSPANCVGTVNTGSIGDTVFNDANANGIQDAGETGIAGVLITLLDENDEIIGTTTSDSNGNYIFDDLPAGDYTVIVGAGPNNTYNSTSTTVSVSLGVNEDFVSADFGFAPCGSISGVVYVDENGNGMYDAGEALVAGATVTLTDANGNITGTVVTGANGVYVFNSCLHPGTLTVAITNIPPGFVGTTIGSFDVNLGSGEHVDVTDGFNFGLTIPVVCPNPIVIDYETVCLQGSDQYVVAFTISGGSGVYNMPSGDFVANNVTTGIVWEFVVTDGDTFSLVAMDADPNNTICAQATVNAGQDETCDDEPQECNGLGLSADQICPEVQNGMFDLFVTITGGNAPFSLSVNGGNAFTIAGSSNQIGPFADNSGISVTVTDANNCTFEYSISNINCIKATAVELMEFNAYADREVNNVEWVTATETDNDYFTVQRSTDGVNFETIGNVNAAGNSVVVNGYSFIDTNPLVGGNYYRLLATDFDGLTEVASDVVLVDRAASLTVTTNGTVQSDDLIISIGSSSIANGTVQIYDVSGKLVYNNDVVIEGATDVNVNLAEFGAGVYIINVTNGNENATLRFIK